MGTPGSRSPSPRSRRAGLPRRRSGRATGVQGVDAQAREAEILLRFAVRLAGIEIHLPPRERDAARRALLLERSSSLAAVRALAAAERHAAVAKRLAAAGDRTIVAASFRNAAATLTRRLKPVRRSRVRRRYPNPTPRPGG